MHWVLYNPISTTQRKKEMEKWLENAKNWNTLRIWWIGKQIYANMVQRTVTQRRHTEV